MEMEIESSFEVSVLDPENAGSWNAPNVFVTAILICEIQVRIIFAVFPVSQGAFFRLKNAPPPKSRRLLTLDIIRP